MEIQIKPVPVGVGEERLIIPEAPFQALGEAVVAVVAVVAVQALPEGREEVGARAPLQLLPHTMQFL